MAWNVNLPRIGTWQENRAAALSSVDEQYRRLISYVKPHNPNAATIQANADKGLAGTLKTEVPVDPTPWIGKKLWLDSAKKSGLSDRPGGAGNPNVVGIDSTGAVLYLNASYGGRISHAPANEHGWQHDNFGLIISAVGAAVVLPAVGSAIGGAGSGIGGAVESTTSTIVGAAEKVSSVLGVGGVGPAVGVPAVGAGGKILGFASAIGGIEKGGGTVSNLQSVLGVANNGALPSWLQNTLGNVDKGIGIYEGIRNTLNPPKPPPVLPVQVNATGGVSPAVLLVGAALVVFLLMKKG